jgi:hypothetical protein
MSVEFTPMAPPVHLLEIVERSAPPVVPLGWRFAPLHLGSPTRWVAWDETRVTVVVVLGATPPDLLNALVETSYAERLWAEPVGDGLYRLDNSPRPLTPVSAQPHQVAETVNHSELIVPNPPRVAPEPCR